MCASRMASRCTSRDLGVGAKCALGRALSLKGRCIPSLLWHAAPVDVCISDEGVKGVRERWVIGRESALRLGVRLCPVAVRSGRGSRGARSRAPILSPPRAWAVESVPSPSGD